MWFSMTCAYAKFELGLKCETLMLGGTSHIIARIVHIFAPRTGTCLLLSMIILIISGRLVSDCYD